MPTPDRDIPWRKIAHGTEESFLHLIIGTTGSGGEQIT